MARSIFAADIWAQLKRRPNQHLAPMVDNAFSLFDAVGNAMPEEIEPESPQPLDKRGRKILCVIAIAILWSAKYVKKRLGADAALTILLSAFVSERTFRRIASYIGSDLPNTICKDILAVFLASIPLLLL